MERPPKKSSGISSIAVAGESHTSRNRARHHDQRSRICVQNFADEACVVVDEYLRVNCGRCGKALLVRFEDLRANRTVDCDECKCLSHRSRSSTGSLSFESSE